MQLHGDNILELLCLGLNNKKLFQFQPHRISLKIYVTQLLNFINFVST